jgi:hypothetical protein
MAFAKAAAKPSAYAFAQDSAFAFAFAQPYALPVDSQVTEAPALACNTGSHQTIDRDRQHDADGTGS